MPQKTANGNPLSRRSFLLSGASLLATGTLLPSGAFGASGLQPTPPQTTGPFYPDVLPLDQDNDLVSVQGEDGQAKGVVTQIYGQLKDTDGRPIRRARIEIWQCDALGRYIHSLDARRGPRDPNFQGYGHTLTDDQGYYRFRTIRPVPYPGRAPHIHFAVKGKGFDRLTTQMNVEGEPRNEKDFLLGRLSAQARRSLIVPLKPAPNLQTSDLSGQFDIVLGDRRWWPF
jgi:protocatechuate 3,4-dioxygenase beta subunit